MAKLSENNTQYSSNLTEKINRSLERFSENQGITNCNDIPSNIPGIESNGWILVKDPICVYFDMAGSTQLSASNHHAGTTAKIYRLYISAATSILSEFNAEYINVNGDEVFGMFNSNMADKAVCAAVSFKTFFENVFTPAVSHQTRGRVNIGNHIGIDQKTTLVKMMGIRRRGESNDRQREVWAGKVVNMAAKLANLEKNNSVIISDRFFESLKREEVLKTCSCSTPPQDLWVEYPLTTENHFDFSKAYKLNSIGWCETHGKAAISAIMNS